MKTTKWTITGKVMAAVMLAAGGAWAGSLDPTNAPGPTMHTLEEIYQQLQMATQQVAEVQQQVTDMQARMLSAGMQQTSGSMVLIPAGSFVMRACTNVGQESISDAEPQHTVYVSAFYMDATEVTKAKWDEVHNWATNHGYSFQNTGSGKATNHPVHTVNWYDCVAWANARSRHDGFTPCYTNLNGTTYTNSTVVFSGGCNWSANGYRLPTEAEWEKAARGGVANRRFPWDDANTIQHARANYYASSSYSYDTSATTACIRRMPTGPPLSRVLWVRLRRMGTGFTTWRATCRSGVGTGIRRITTAALPAAIREVRRRARSGLDGAATGSSPPPDAALRIGTAARPATRTTTWASVS